MKELQLHNDLNRHFIFTTKTIEKQWTILLGVSFNYDAEYVIHYIIACYKAHEDKLYYIRKTTCRSLGLSKWLIPVPVPLTRLIISDGGLLLGFKSIVTFARTPTYNAAGSAKN